MVNENLSSKQIILNTLRENTESISGEKLSEIAGISRTAVWKAVQSLQNSGYEINVSRTGYSLVKDLSDSLYPWEFGGKEKLFSHFSITKSTMDNAREIAQGNSSEKIHIVTSDVQTEGKGHNNHKWTTTDGALAFTVVNKDKITCFEEYRLVMASGISMVHVLEKNSGRKFYLRWPNDIWSEDGKVGGILDEFNSIGSFCDWVNLGIGLNINKKPRIKNSDCIFDKNKSIARKNILSDFITEFTEWKKIAYEDSNSLEKEWNNLCMDSGKKILLTDGRKCKFEKINSYGFLEVKIEGENKIITPGTLGYVKEI